MPSPLCAPIARISAGGLAWVRRELASNSHKRVAEGRIIGLLGPAVRNILEQYGISAEKVAGSGPRGSLLKGDVLTFIRDQNLKPAIQHTVALPIPGSLSKKPSAVGKPGPKDARGRVKYLDFQVTGNIRDNATAAVKGKTSIPHAYLYTVVSVDDALKVFSGKKGLENISLTDIVTRAVVASAQSNDAVQGDIKGRGQSLDIGVQLYRDGLLQCAVLRKAHSLGLKEVASHLKKSVSTDFSALEGCRYKIVSLVGSRLDQITEALTPQQLWAISIGDSLTRIDAQSKASSKVVTLSLTYDSSVISEKDAARFLEDVKKSIERPVLVLLGARSKIASADLAW